jgi:hypothetical protein
MSDVSSARRVKDRLKSSFAGEPWCTGIAVEREDGVGFIVRISIAAGTGTEQQSRIPNQLEGVMIKVVENDA